jgi:hypothetical protein
MRTTSSMCTETALSAKRLLAAVKKKTAFYPLAVLLNARDPLIHSSTHARARTNKKRDEKQSTLYDGKFGKREGTVNGGRGPGRPFWRTI